MLWHAMVEGPDACLAPWFPSSRHEFAPTISNLFLEQTPRGHVFVSYVNFNHERTQP